MGRWQALKLYMKGFKIIVIIGIFKSLSLRVELALCAYLCLFNS